MVGTAVGGTVVAPGEHALMNHDTSESIIHKRFILDSLDEIWQGHKDKMAVGAVLFLGPRTSTISTLEARLSQEWIASIEAITVMFPRRARQVAVLKQRVTIPKQLAPGKEAGRESSFCHLEVAAERVSEGVNTSARIELPVSSIRPSGWRDQARRPRRRARPGRRRGDNLSSPREQ